MTSPAFCPTCQSALRERPLLDSHLKGYACQNGHRFYLTLIAPLGIPTADTIRPPAMTDDLQILRFWLTDQDARERVPNQLAVVCRRILDIREDGHRIARVPYPFMFCPRCGDALARFDSDDLHMQGLHCDHFHEFWEHGGTVYYGDRRQRTRLSAELSDDDLPQQIEYYAGNSEYITPYVHSQLRDVLKRFAESL
jgi:hypothetical protein